MSDGILGNGRMAELLDGLIRVGKVAEHVPGARVRVTFADRDGVTSQPLQVVQRRTVGAQDNDMPALGEAVLCLMNPPDQTDGFCLGALYDATNPPPEGDPAVRVIGGTDIRLGSSQAGHPAPFGDVLLKILVGLRELLASVQVATPSGPGQLTGATTDYGSGLFSAIAGAMAADVDGAVLNSATVKLE